MSGYAKRYKFKVTRTEHAVSFIVGQTAEEFQRALSNVPAGAKLIDVEDDERYSDGSATLVFLEESKDSSDAAGESSK